MTLRGVGLLIGGVALMVAGWVLGWPELSVLGVACVLTVLLAVVVASGRSAAYIDADVFALRVVRGESAELRVVVRTPRRLRLARLVEGDPALPRRSFVLGARTHMPASVAVPVDTSRRGLHPMGPFRVVRGDPWSVVRRVVAVSDEGSVLVRPRTFPVRPGFAAMHRQGESEAMTRRSGDEHFFALRDYVLGDEPRNVHWRSSARSGRLVVKQKVAAAVDGALLLLDVDATAYPSVETFGEGFLEDRFEAAVEVLASLCRARAADGHRIRFATTGRAQPSLGVDLSVPSVLDALALVRPMQPLDCDPIGLPALARRSHCSQLIVVTGAPSSELVAAVRRCGSLSPVVVRVGGVPTGWLPGATVLDVPDALALA